jgi:hypothetical protein
MSARPVLLDFKSRPRQGGLVGAILLLFGIIAATVTSLEFRASSLTREALELRLDALNSTHNPGSSATRSSVAEEAGPIVTELAAPWSLLLQELESAGQDTGGDVAVLAVEPDREKSRVRIVAEAHDLATALAYIERLQKSRALRFPMLDSHEIRTEDHEQPVRFQLSAEWKNLT